jgi:hypothetical protein
LNLVSFYLTLILTQLLSTELIERLRILEDARQLKQLAAAFLHPERPVEVESTLCARCYFDRHSAPEQESNEEAEERRAVLEDAAALKRLAVDYMHPEIHVESSDMTSCARCYFDRPSVPQQESVEDAEERALILEDVKSLRRAAFEYLHPEVGVVTSDPIATARCYFDRPSAIVQESVEEVEERRMALADAAALKRLAVDYMHPELGVVTSDPTVTARCYFGRASAVEQESNEVVEERIMALADASALKRLAVDYMHPEVGVVSSNTATARCYFDRFSAIEQESVEEGEVRAMTLADAAALKRLAVDYMHPELGVVTSDPTATARCYFDRPSAPEQESVQDVEERTMALADAAALKRLAVDYMHPEMGVVTSDITATARCYFDRPSAIEQESVEEAEERTMALSDAASLKRLAVDYMHPELEVVTSDPTAIAHCYFDRPSVRFNMESVAPTTPKKAPNTVSLPVSKDTGIKSINMHSEGSFIIKSASAVQLYGLDSDHDDSGSF